MVGYVSNMALLQIHTVTIFHSLDVYWATPTLSTALDFKFTVWAERFLFSYKSLVASPTRLQQRLPPLSKLKGPLFTTQEETFPKAMCQPLWEVREWKTALGPYRSPTPTGSKSYANSSEVSPPFSTIDSIIAFGSLREWEDCGILLCRRRWNLSWVELFT